MQAGNHSHAGFGNIVLGEGYGEFLGAVVAVVEEYDSVPFLDGAVDSGIVDWLDEFVGHVLVIALLHGGCHVACLLAFAFDEKVVGHFHALPAFVAVHGVVAAYD